MNRSLLNAKLALLVSTAAGLGLTNQAMAQGVAGADANEVANSSTSDAFAEGDIVVTARKREETMLSVPVNVSAINGASLQNYNIDSLTKVSEALPFVDVVQRSTGTIFAVRGIGSSPVDAGLPQSVSVVIDGLQVNQGNFSSLALFDIAQVQAMKGPQALFFGKNSPAGVIEITSADPGRRWEVKGDALYEFNAQEKLLDLAAGGPVSSTLGVRLALRYRDMDGFLFNRVAAFVDPILGIPIAAEDGRVSSAKELSGRLTLLWNPTENFTAKLKLSASRLETDNPASQTREYSCAPGQTVPRMTVPDPQNSCEFSRTYAVASFPQQMLHNVPVKEDGLYSDRKTYTATLSMEYDMDQISLASTSSFGRYRLDGLSNNSGAVYPYLGGLLGEDFDIAQQELRVTSDLGGAFNFMVGAFLEKTRLVTSGYRFLGALGPAATTGNYFGVFSSPRQRGSSYSVFAEGRFKITAELELSGGVRYSKDVRKLDRLGNELVHPIVAPLLLPEGVVLAGKFKDDNFSPEVTITYKPSADLMVYGAFKTGYKSGGFGMPNVIYASQTANGSSFQSETVKGFEAGVKGRIAGDLSYQLTAYTYLYKDLQTVAFVNGALGLNYVYGNAPKARTRGVELQVNWEPILGLKLRASGGYNQARYLSYMGAPCYTAIALTPGCTQDLGGKRLPNSADFSGDIGFSYRADVGRFTVEPYADVNYQSKQNVSAVLNPAALIGGYARVNAGISLRPTNGPWELKLFGRNLTNHFKPTSIDDKPRGLPGELIAQSVNRPREIWLSLGLSF